MRTPFYSFLALVLMTATLCFIYRSDLKNLIYESNKDPLNQTWEEHSYKVFSAGLSIGRGMTLRGATQADLDMVAAAFRNNDFRPVDAWIDSHP